jgi:hypothetical protein
VAENHIYYTSVMCLEGFQWLFIGIERLGIKDSNIPIISIHINFYIYIYIFLCALEVSNKNLLELEGLELEVLEDSNSFQSSNAHHCYTYKIIMDNFLSGIHCVRNQLCEVDTWQSRSWLADLYYCI